MQPEHFMQLHRSLERLRGVSPLWPAILAYRIARCGGFMEQLTLGEADSSSVLAAHTVALLDTLPVETDDRTLVQMLAAGFDGFYWHACGTSGGRTAHWNSLHESFHAFCARTAVSELVQLSVPHTSEAEAASWLLAAATGGALCR
ncbi:MAG: hypothetical protein ACFNKE_01340 [Neisseria elongata]